MKRPFLAVAAAAFVLAAQAAQSSITISAFDASTYNPSFNTGSNIGEDFEGLGASGGEREVGFVGTPFDTMRVGTFVTLGGTGTGGTTNPAWNSGEGLALRSGSVYGRANTTPDDGRWFLDSNDTHGVHWEASLFNGKAFDRIRFSLSDAADQKAFVEVTDGTHTETLSLQGNGNVKLIDIVFGAAVPNATIKITNFKSDGGPLKINDGFGMDGIQISAVPVPASLSIALLGVAGFGAYRARQKRRAA